MGYTSLTMVYIRSIRDLIELFAALKTAFEEERKYSRLPARSPPSFSLHPVSEVERQGNQVMQSRKTARGPFL